MQKATYFLYKQQKNNKMTRNHNLNISIKRLTKNGRDLTKITQKDFQSKNKKLQEKKKYL